MWRPLKNVYERIWLMRVIEEEEKKKRAEKGQSFK